MRTETIQRSSTFRLSTWAGIALALTFGIAATNPALPAASSSISASAPLPASAARNVAGRLHHWYQLGSASWYGKYFQGHATASGEHYNMFDLTCAHRSLPLGTLIRVTNLQNHKTVVVRVNDRGPVPESRIIDLSYAAANYLGVTGVSKVRLDLLPTVAQLNWPALGSR